MLSLASGVRIFLCTAPTDMRKSFDGLFALVETVIGEDPFSGHLFLFRNRKRDRVKLLYWDRDGLAIWYKRLEAGCYQFPCDWSAGRHLGQQRADPQPHTTSNHTAADPTEADQSAEPPPRLEIQADELAMLLGGIDLAHVKRRKRYVRRSA